MTTLIIARHGNTFDPHEIPRRVGAKTNLPLVAKGREQAAALGHYLKDNDLVPDRIFTSRLQRTVETAYVAIQEAGCRRAPMTPLEIFDEIDYGPDENQTEQDVIARIGIDAITAWDERAAVPDGWIVDPEKIIQNLHNFADNLINQYEYETILVVTSNGIARFIPHLTEDFETFRQHQKLKISTGALCVLKHDHETGWTIEDWNVRPS